MKKVYCKEYHTNNSEVKEYEVTDVSPYELFTGLFYEPDADYSYSFNDIVKYCTDFVDYSRIVINKEKEEVTVIHTDDDVSIYYLKEEE